MKRSDPKELLCWRKIFVSGCMGIMCVLSSWKSKSSRRSKEGWLPGASAIGRAAQHRLNEKMLVRWGGVVRAMGSEDDESVGWSSFCGGAVSSINGNVG